MKNKMEQSFRNKELVIEEFCHLAAEVNEHKFAYQLSSDCFCDKNVAGFVFDAEVLEFIKAAVWEKLERESNAGLIAEVKAKLQESGLKVEHDKIATIRILRNLKPLGLKEAVDWVKENTEILKY